jgi:hypothetical protein
MPILTRYVIFEKKLPTTEIIRVIGNDKMGRKQYTYHCDNCDNCVIIGEEYCNICSRTFSAVKTGIYMRPGVYIQYN